MNKLKIPWFALLAFPLFLSANSAEDASEILVQSKATGGLIVQLGCGNGKLLAELGKDARFLVHGLERDSSKIESAGICARGNFVFPNLYIVLFVRDFLPYGFLTI